MHGRPDKEPSHAFGGIIGMRLAQDVKIGWVREGVNRDAPIEQLVRHAGAIINISARLRDINVTLPGRKLLFYIHINDAKAHIGQA